jgi:hypothetical protein
MVLVQIAVMELRVEIQNPQFQASAEAYAKKLCKKLSPDFQPECSETIDQYGPLVRPFCPPATSTVRPLIIPRNWKG